MYGSDWQAEEAAIEHTRKVAEAEKTTVLCPKHGSTAVPPGTVNCPKCVQEAFYLPSAATAANTPGLHLDAGKPQIDGIDPVFFEAVGKILEYGAQKYAKYNWIKGIHFSRIYASAMRHLLKWYECDDIDEESKLPHLWHAACNLMFLITYTEHGRYDKFDDRPFYDQGEVGE